MSKVLILIPCNKSVYIYRNIDIITYLPQILERSLQHYINVLVCHGWLIKYSLAFVNAWIRFSFVFYVGTNGKFNYLPYFLFFQTLPQSFVDVGIFKSQFSNIHRICRAHEDLPWSFLETSSRAHSIWISL